MYMYTCTCKFIFTTLFMLPYALYTILRFSFKFTQNLSNNILLAISIQYLWLQYIQLHVHGQSVVGPNPTWGYSFSFFHLPQVSVCLSFFLFFFHLKCYHVHVHCTCTCICIFTTLFMVSLCFIHVYNITIQFQIYIGFIKQYLAWLAISILVTIVCFDNYMYMFRYMYYWHLLIIVRKIS